MPDIYFGGGINQRDDHNIHIEECTEGQNFVLDAQSRSFFPRPPFDLKATATNGQAIGGICQLIKRDDSDTTLIFAGSDVYSANDSWALSDVGDITTSDGIRCEYWSLDDNLMIVDRNKTNKIHAWDGTSFTPHLHGIGNGTVTSATGIDNVGSTLNITHTAHGLSVNDLATIAGITPAGWNGEYVVTAASANGFSVVNSASLASATGSATFEESVDLYAKYAVAWNNRMWLFNITTDTSDNPHMILASAFEDANNYDTSVRSDVWTSGGLTGDEAFYLLTPDLKPINGVVVFYNTIIISTIDGRLFKITGTDSSNYAIEEYYPGSAAIGRDTLVNIGNDIMWMKKGGNIDRLSSVEQFGDVKADDLSRFIPREIQGINDGIAVYDETRQRIHWFVSEKVLTLDKNMLTERPDLSPWSVYKTNHSSGFNANAATYMRDLGRTTYDVYYGGDNGAIYKLNGTLDNGDAGDTSIVTKRKTRFITEIPVKHTNLLGRVEYRRRGASTLNLMFEFGETEYTAICAVPLRGIAVTSDAEFWSGDAYWSGDFYWNLGSAPIDVMSTKGFSPAGKGRGFFLELSHDTKVNFLINRIIL